MCCSTLILISLIVPPSPSNSVRGNNFENSVCSGGWPSLVQTESTVRRQKTCCAEGIEYVL